MYENKEVSQLSFFRLRAYLGQSNYLFKEPDRATCFSMSNKVYRNYKLGSNHNIYMSRPLIQLFSPLHLIFVLVSYTYM